MGPEVQRYHVEDRLPCSTQLARQPAGSTCTFIRRRHSPQ
jgi:hypothetical protein